MYAVLCYEPTLRIRHNIYGGDGSQPKVSSLGFYIKTVTKVGQRMPQGAYIGAWI